MHDIESFFREDMKPEEAWVWIRELAGNSQVSHLQEVWNEKGLDGWREAKAYLVETFDPMKTFTFVVE